MKKTIGIILATVCVCLVIGFALYFKVLVDLILSVGMAVLIVGLVCLICWLINSEEDND